MVRSIFAPGGDHASLAAGRGTVIDMRVFALLCARLCHELSGPIGAANNGTESLADEDLDFAHEAVELISASVRQAAGRLQFYRFAYGFSGSGAAAGIEPRELVARLFGESRIACEYSDTAAVMPLEWQKLACNLLLVGAGALPRGGRLVLATSALEIEAVGDAPALSPETLAALTLVTPVDALTLRTIQAYFTGVLAASLGYRLIRVAEPQRVRLAAVATAD